ncbi:hypothetical protein D3C76_1583480 [compost metagenome]
MSNYNDETQIFELINNIDKYEFDEIANIKFYEDELPNNKILPRITDKTFLRLGLKRRDSLFRYKRSIIAKASIFVFLSAAIIAAILSMQLI